MKNIRILSMINIIFALITVSCRKNHSEGISIDKLNNLVKKLTIEDAKSYCKSLEIKYGNYDSIKTSTKSKQNFKNVDLMHAYFGENETAYFVEFPISYTTREIILSSDLSIPPSVIKKMFSNSFDRLVIYKDKMSGIIKEKVITIIPSVNYLSNSSLNLYNNHYQSVTKDFSGYVSSKTWKGEFLSSQSYNIDKINQSKNLISNDIIKQSSNDLKVSRVNDINCDVETIYRAYVSCEDVDANGNGVNCEYVIYSYDANVCSMEAPTFHNHTAILPSSNNSYWSGFPDPKPDPAYNCSPDRRAQESPVLYAGIFGSSFSLTFWEACFCQGYSWIIFEDVSTGIEYSVPITNQNFLQAGCTSIWETNFEIPNSIPNGTYFIKVILDGDIFYHQFEKNGAIIRRFKHSLFR